MPPPAVRRRCLKKLAPANDVSNCLLAALSDAQRWRGAEARPRRRRTGGGASQTQAARARKTALAICRLRRAETKTGCALSAQRQCGERPRQHPGVSGLRRFGPYVAGIVAATKNSRGELPPCEHMRFYLRLWSNCVRHAEAKKVGLAYEFVQSFPPTLWVFARIGKVQSASVSLRLHQRS